MPGWSGYGNMDGGGGGAGDGRDLNLAVELFARTTSGTAMSVAGDSTMRMTVAAVGASNGSSPSCASMAMTGFPSM